MQARMIDAELLYPIDRPLRYVGWIKSRGKVLGGWRSGYCVVENGSVLWYRDEAQTSLKRQFSLKECTVTFHADDPSIPLTCVCLSSPPGQRQGDEERRFILKYHEKGSRGTWLSYLRAHIEWAHR
jgi:hypothetical protein